MHNEYWNTLLDHAELIATLSVEDDDQKKEVASKLDGLQFIFDRQFDPADHYQEFVALKLCKSFLLFIERQSS